MEHRELAFQTLKSMLSDVVIQAECPDRDSSLNQILHRYASSGHAANDDQYLSTAVIFDKVVGKVADSVRNLSLIRMLMAYFRLFFYIRTNALKKLGNPLRAWVSELFLVFTLSAETFTPSHPQP
jgi:hypothetical protein